jgi:hypothetical protein
MVDPLAVLAASVASFVFGAVWYSPVLLLPRWSRAAGVDASLPMRNPTRVFALSFAFTVLGALLLSYLLRSDAAPLRGALLGGAVGIAAGAASLGINYQFAGRSSELLLIDGGFHVLRMALMGLVVGLLQ